MCYVTMFLHECVCVYNLVVFIQQTDGSNGMDLKQESVQHTTLHGACVQICLFGRACLCHELIGDGLQQLRRVLLGADEVSFSGRSRLQRQKGSLQSQARIFK